MSGEHTLLPESLNSLITAIMLFHMLIWCKNYRPSATLYFLPVFFLSIVVFFFNVIEIHSMNIFVTSFFFFPFIQIQSFGLTCTTLG